jgi:hypothetical protein
VDQAIAPNLKVVWTMIAAHPGPFPELLRALVGRLSLVMTTLPVGGVVKMVIGEAGNFPELARVWHDDLVAHALGALAEAVHRAQARGEVRTGDPRMFALQIVGPMLMGVIWDEVFVPAGGAPFDVPALARQHAETMILGLSPREDRP